MNEIIKTGATEKAPHSPSRVEPIVIGVDVGSTTVKATVVAPDSLEILWQDYQRHQTRQPEKVLEFLERIEAAFPNVPLKDIRIFITGSGAGPLVEHIGAKFVQEVNAVTMAVEELHPDAGSVVELGGQDAKIIIFKVNEVTGDKQAQTSMNDKCASGTGATIDKCMVKVGMHPDEMADLPFDASKLHHVAAKCGVFAETDIVNLVKSSIPSAEIMCSLADAIVMQNLSVLTRGNTLKDKVILLGGPNSYLPFLQECWRKRIPETWAERGYEPAKDIPVDELILVPENALYYAAFGSVLYGLHEPEGVGSYLGMESLREFIKNGRKTKLGEKAGPPLIAEPGEMERVEAEFKLPDFKIPEFTSGKKIRGAIGLDGGSTSSKAVLVDEKGNVLRTEYQLSKGNPLQDMKEMLGRMSDKVKEQGAELDVIGFGATGYAADVLEKGLKADVNIVETVAHMKSAVHYFGDVDVICDIGGQDIKVLFMMNGELKNFRLSNQCSAGNGMLLQAMADQFGVPVTEFAENAFKAELSPRFSYGCAVFLDTDRVNFQKEGYTKEELMAGLAMVLPKNVWQYVVQIPRMAELGRRFVLQGGTQYNLAAVKAQADYIKERVPDSEVLIHPHPGLAGAIGAAMETWRVVERRGHSTFVGLEEAINLNYTTRNDEETRCNFCPNNCARTFIDTSTSGGQTARYISGFSCEKGTVEDKEALKVVTKERNSKMKRYPNLVTYEARRAFAQLMEGDPLPEAGTPVEDIRVKKGLLGGRKYTPFTRGFMRSSEEIQAKRAQVRIGLPRVLNMWNTAPFWNMYFRALGVPAKNLVWSDETTEEMFGKGSKYGAIDPCYPSKVAQAHIHNLLFEHHTEEKPLDFLFFPTITHITTFMEHVNDSSSCPVVAGTPNVMKAAFTKEVDFFAQRGIEYVDHAVAFTEPRLLLDQMLKGWGERLGITADENAFAIEQGWKAMNLLDAELEERGKQVLEEVEKENRMAILLLGRPYHLDPGLNHDITEEFQALGYPVISTRSIPKDPEWLKRFFADDLARGVIQSPLEINDVWFENHSTNSAQKVWAAKFASRHPNLAVLDLSSFKCGHDAPTYGIIDSIIAKAKTPFSALHDIDANKPTGSIKIRVKTYAYSLKLRQEQMDDKAKKTTELEKRLRQKELELLTASLESMGGNGDNEGNGTVTNQGNGPGNNYEKEVIATRIETLIRLLEMNGPDPGEPEEALHTEMPIGPGRGESNYNL